jgi:2-desacetyl-2-hydroxyethyl bacteriochlorophyllide A dehydrogenase
MQAVMRRGARLICEEVADPVPGPGQALVKSLACGICGSDLHAFQQGWGGQLDRAGERAFVFGHEYCAEVLESKRFRPGTRVVAMPFARGPDGTETIGYSARFPGGFAERMVLTEDLMIEVPNGLSADVAALTEPMAVGAHGVARASLDKDSVALVIGAGPVGAAVIAGLKARGFGPVIVADFSPKRRALAERLGADVVIDPAAESPYGRWADLGVPTGYDPMAPLLKGQARKRAVIFECVGAPGVLETVLAGAPYGSEVVLLGVCMERDSLVPAPAVTKEITLRGACFYSAQEFERCLLDLAEGLIDGQALITDRVGLSGVAGAFERLAKPNTDMKIIVEPGRA